MAPLMCAEDIFSPTQALISLLPPAPNGYLSLEMVCVMFMFPLGLTIILIGFCIILIFTPWSFVGHCEHHNLLNKSFSDKLCEMP